MKGFSFKICGDMAFFKKNDANDIAFVSYNFIHKPAVLGIFGAILGMKGYKLMEESHNEPEYYNALKNFEIAIIPTYKRPPKKVFVTFNDSTGLSSEEKGGVLQVKEQVLIGPLCYKIIVPLFESFSKDEKGIYLKLEEMVSKQYSCYPIYFGKNEFPAYFIDFTPIELSPLVNKETNVDSLVRKNDVEILTEDLDEEEEYTEKITVLEELPYAFDEKGIYKKDIFILTENKVRIKKPEKFFRVGNNVVYTF